MRLKSFVCLSVLALPLLAQIGPTPPPGVTYVTVDPAGSCGAVPMQYNRTNGNLWGCDAGTWTLVTGGGGGAPTGPAGGGLAGTYPNPTLLRFTAGAGTLTGPAANGVAATLGNAETLLLKTVDGVTPTVFGFLPNITSDVQAQLNAKGSVAGTTGALQYNNAGALAGNVLDLFYNATALPTPSAPTVVPSPAGATSWGYVVVAVNLVGHTIHSAETVAAGAAALDLSNKNTITTPAASGSTGCQVYRSTADGTPATTGFIGQVTCGLALDDTGLAITGNPNGYFQSTSQGSAVRGEMRQPDLLCNVGVVCGDNGDVTPSAFYGSEINSFSPGFVGPDMLWTKFLFTHHGNSWNVIDNLASLIETTDSGEIAVGGYSATSGTGRPQGGYFEAWNTGVNTLGAEDAAATNVRIISSGNVTEGNGFAFRGTRIADGATGLFTTAIGFHALNDSWVGANNAAAFQSDLDAGTTPGFNYAFYAKGTAPSFFGGSLRLIADLANPFVGTKTTQTATAPGAGLADLRWIAGTNSGTCKLVANAGTSATEVTIVDNVGSGC